MKQRSVKASYLKYTILSSLVVSLLATFIYAWYSDRSLYTFLVETKLASIPVSLIVIGASILIGAHIGFFVNFYVKRSFNNLSRALLELERGNFTYKLSKATYREFQEIEAYFLNLSKKMEEQALSFQEKTTARIGKEQQLLEDAVSHERNRLARELHDSVSQQLFAISMMGSAMNEVTDEDSPIKKQLQLVEEMSIQAQGEMRALLLHLRPIQLEGKNLADGITDLLTELSSKHHSEMVWHIEPIELAKGVEDHLFRILQEALSNTLRHARAKRIEVRLRKIESFAMLKIIDDGVGFDTNIRKAGSYGLHSMQERADEIGGLLKINSLPNKGTQIEVRVPLLQKEGGCTND